MNSVRTHYRELKRRTGLGGAQVWALGEISAKPGISMNELADCMDVHTSTASNLVRSLKARDLVRTKPDPADRRSVALWVAPQGRAVLRRVANKPGNALAHALQETDSATLKRLRRDLRTIIETLGAGEDAAQTPLADL
jgi:DNA-binding MarR family transcriptional regulator